jgi:hypothetical protein
MMASSNYNPKFFYPEPEEPDPRLNKAKLEAEKRNVALKTAGFINSSNRTNLINLVGAITILLGIFPY